MKLEAKDLLLYGVTDRSWLGGSTLLAQVEEALQGGLSCVQLREKDLAPEVFLAEAREIQALCRRYQVPFFINDSLEIAQKIQADGIHVGQSDQNPAEIRKMVGDSMILGVSVQTVDQARLAQDQGADYLGVGAVFSTSTKLDARPVPRSVVEDITRAVDLPVVAIGGISAENILELRGCGLAGVAVVSAIFASPQIQEATRTLKDLSRQVVG